MPQFLVVAYDDCDPGACVRRQVAQSAHHDGLRLMGAKGEVIAGSTILNDTGNIIGSAFFVDFAKRSDLDEWLAHDPYSTGKVWKHIHVKPIRNFFPDQVSLSKILEFYLNIILEFVKKYSLIQILLAIIGSSSIIFYLLVVSYSNRYAIPVYDTI